MPLLALRRLRSHISKKYFYTFGLKSATKPFVILFTSIFFICFISYPVVLEYKYPFRQSTNDFIDAHVWQFSPHVYAINIAPTFSNNFIAQQIRVSANSPILSKDLLNNTLSIYESITNSRTTWNGQSVSLQDICVTAPQRSTCLVQSPLAYWNNDRDCIERDSDLIETINNRMHDSSSHTRLSLHPYSTMGNVILDNQGHFISADSLILTIVLKNTSTTMKIWNALWQHTKHQLDLSSVKQLDVQPCLLQYKLKILPTPSLHIFTVVSFGIGLFFLIKNQFGKSNLIKSKSGLGITTLFLSLACYTTTMGIFHIFHVEVHVTPWFLQILVCTTATLEHALLLTGAVVSREKDISVKERIGKGLQQVGILMATALIGELIVLGTGSAMKANNVKSFCIFASLALIVAYILNLTLFIAVLSIDVRRAELTDLGNEEKITSHGRHHDNYGRRFKTRRAINALFLCVILLSLSIFSPTNDIKDPVVVDRSKRSQLMSISNQFWNVMNPYYKIQQLEIQPPYTVILSDDVAAKEKQMDKLTSYYTEKLFILRRSIADDGQFSLFDSVRPFLLLIFSINVPGVLLSIILVGIMMWMVPYVREKLLLPILRMIFVRVSTFLLRVISTLTPIKTDSLIRKVENDYNEDGVHLGAISLQSQFNKLQNENSVCNVKIRTLAGSHIADIRRLDASDGMVVSTGQDGRIILWDGKRGEWIARLDRLRRLGGGLNGWVAEKNPAYYGTSKVCNGDVKKSDTRRLPRARCVQIDDEGKCVIAGFENGMIRVWNTDFVHLIRELSISTMKTNEEDGLCKRNQQYASADHNPNDRVIELVFLDEKLPAAASNIEPSKNLNKKKVLSTSLNHFILSVHKSGTLREWNIKTGEMIQCIDSGHVREITAIHVLPNNQREKYRFIFTASKDGTVKCWERIMNYGEDSTQWKCLYSIDGHDGHCMTSLAARQLNNGMGILVTGSSDGAIKVWNLDSGDAICTLSKRSIIKKKMPAAEVGGPLLQFSRVARSDDNNNAYQNRRKQELVISDHSDSVCQVVVTPIGNPEFKNDRCPSCNTVINSGFFVASCSLDETVHTWRLDRTGLSKDVGCTRCLKDYHRQQHYMRCAWKISSDDSPPSAGPVSALRSKQRKKLNGNKSMLSGDESEFSAVSTELSLHPLFLGKLDQFAGRGLVFCNNMVLAGVRRHHTPSNSVMNSALLQSQPAAAPTQQQLKDGQWEVWFASLQYYEPPSLEEDASLIPVISYDLEKDDNLNIDQLVDSSHTTSSSPSSNSLWNQFLLHAFGIRKVRSAASRPNSVTRKNFKHNEMYERSETSEEQSEYQDEEEEDEDEDDAYDILPFSAIRHVVPTNGFGLGCDYGNFIKIVSFDDPTSITK